MELRLTRFNPGGRAQKPEAAALTFLAKRLPRAPHLPGLQRSLLGPSWTVPASLAPGKSETRNWLFGPGVGIRMNFPSKRARPEPELPALAWPSPAGQKTRHAINENRWPRRLRPPELRWGENPACREAGSCPSRLGPQCGSLFATPQAAPPAARAWRWRARSWRPKDPVK